MKDLCLKIILLILVVIIVSSCGKEDMVLTYPSAPPLEKLRDESLINKEELWGTLNTHDPSVIKENGVYYCFSTDAKVGGDTGMGIQIRKSDDLISWEYVGLALDVVPEEVLSYTGATNLWAPEIVKMKDKFYLYYSASHFGSNTSMIVLATSDDIMGPYEHQEIVKETKRVFDTTNAIDPNIVFDKDGKPYFVYGSFWDGITIHEMDPETGLIKEGDEGTLISSRPVGGVEGPYIIYNKAFNMYYLFVSYDSLNGSYNVRVARSESITGPYIDMNGHDLLEASQNFSEPGTKLIGSYSFQEGNGWLAPGHNSVYEEKGTYYMVHHARLEEDKNWHYMHVRSIVWNEEGWPMLSPERYAGEDVNQKISPTLIEGSWQFIRFDRKITEVALGSLMDIKSGGQLTLQGVEGEWEYKGDNVYQFIIPHVADNIDDEEKYDEEQWIVTGKIIVTWDYEKLQETLVFTGFDQTNTAIWMKLE